MPEDVYILNPDIDNPSDHIDMKNIKYKPKTRMGEVNIKVLFLNRKPLTRLREARKKIKWTEDAIGRGMYTLMNYKVDQLPQKMRFRLKALLKDLSGDIETANKLIQATLADFAKSEFLEDPDHKENLAQRREFLKKLNALSPETTEIKIKSS